MRSYVLVLLVLSLLPSLLKAEEPWDYAMKMNLAVGYSLANFYCLNHAWPKNLKKLQKHGVENGAIYLSKREWKEIIKYGHLLSVEDDIGFSFPFGDPAAENMVLSRSSEPNCEEKELKPVMKIIISE